MQQPEDLTCVVLTWLRCLLRLLACLNEDVPGRKKITQAPNSRNNISELTDRNTKQYGANQLEEELVIHKYSGAV